MPVYLNPDRELPMFIEAVRILTANGVDKPEAERLVRDEMDEARNYARRYHKPHPFDVDMRARLRTLLMLRNERIARAL